MFGMGGAELLVILLFAFLIFGPDKLPEIGKTVGKAVRRFKDAQNDMNDVVQENVYKPLKKAMDDGEKEERAKDAEAKSQAAQAAAPATAPASNAPAATASATVTAAAPAASAPSEAASANAQPAAKKESFAERRKRLEAEAAQRAAEAAQSEEA